MLTRFVKVEPAEVRALLWSFAYFFVLLCSYYVLRPVREEMGIQAGVHNLPWLFTATLVAMLCAVPIFGALCARLPRAVLLPVVYGFFALNLLLFYAAFAVDAWRPLTARVFFVWLSVFNLFVVSVFWSFMVDLFTAEQGKRLFGFIAAGGTTGAITGPLVTAVLAPLVGPVPLLLVAAALLTVAIGCIHRLNRLAANRGAAPRGAGSGTPAAAHGEALGGSMWSGIRAVLRSRYLLGICFYLLCYTVLSTLLYVEMMRLVAENFADSGARTRLFAGLDLAVNTLTLAVQVFLTGRVLERLGVTVTLALLPAFAVAGFTVLAAAPLLPVLLVFGVLRRAGEFALSKPAREILFTVVARADKYKAKNFIDTFVYRGGDALAAWFGAGLRALALGLSAVSAIAVPIAGAWLAVAVWLGRRHRLLLEAPRPEAQEPAHSPAAREARTRKPA